MHMDRLVVIAVKEEFEAVLLKNEWHGTRMFNTPQISIFISLDQSRSTIVEATPPHLSPLPN